MPGHHSYTHHQSAGAQKRGTFHRTRPRHRLAPACVKDMGFTGRQWELAKVRGSTAFGGG
eukprot:scaffold363_cov331-Pavlova_lutheri.AAC.55